MWVNDFKAPLNAIQVASEASLLLRLSIVRRGRFGAFILSTSCDADIAPQLWIQISGAYAYVHFFTDVSGADPGYQACGMQGADCPDEVRFIQIGEAEDSLGNTMPDYTLCPLEDSYQAALDFFRHPEAMPSRINWVPL